MRKGRPPMTTLSHLEPVNRRISTQKTQPRTFFSASVSSLDIIQHVSITRVYDQLHAEHAPPGTPARKPNPKARGIGFWRLGDGENIKLDDHTGTYFDFARGEGGGILALIQKVRECSKQEALRWLADMAGIPFSTDRRRRQDTAPIWMQAKVWGWQRECLCR